MNHPFSIRRVVATATAPVRRRRDVSRATMSKLAGAVLIALFAVAAVSCGGDASSGAKPKVVDIIVPPGTQDKLDRGELVNVMPALLEFRVGDTLRVRNDDSNVQFAGPYRVRPGEQFELKFGAPGRFAGLCELSGGARYEIIITE